MHEYESIDWDAKKGSIVITKQERIGIRDAVGIEDALKKINNRLAEIVQAVKVLKAEAEELKKIKNKIAGKTGSIDPV